MRFRSRLQREFQSIVYLRRRTLLGLFNTEAPQRFWEVLFWATSSHIHAVTLSCDMVLSCQRVPPIITSQPSICIYDEVDWPAQLQRSYFSCFHTLAISSISFKEHLFVKNWDFWKTAGANWPYREWGSHSGWGTPSPGSFGRGGSVAGNRMRFPSRSMIQKRIADQSLTQ